MQQTDRDRQTKNITNYNEMHCSLHSSNSNLTKCYLAPTFYNN